MYNHLILCLILVRKKKKKKKNKKKKIIFIYLLFNKKKKKKKATCNQISSFQPGLQVEFYSIPRTFIKSFVQPNIK